MVGVRRMSLFLATSALLLGLAAATGPIAGALPTPAAHSAGAPQPRGTGLFTGGWQEQFDPAGNLVSDVTFDFVGLIANLGPGTIVFEGKVGASQYINKFTGPYAVHLMAGNTYSSDQGASIDTPCVGSFEVDQFTLSGKNATSAAVQYEMTCPDGYSYLGAMAVNLPNVPGLGYYLFTNAGALYGLGNDAYLCYLGDLSAKPLNDPVVAMAPTPDGAGYYMAAADGGIFTYGDATFYGSTGDLHLNSPIVGMAATPDGGGYWLVGGDGGIFAFGDAKYHGSMGGKPLTSPIVGMAATSDGGGYRLVAADGGIFTFGDASYHGSMGGKPLNSPIVGMAATPDGGGYWLVGADGGIFNFGDAAYDGSTGSLHLTAPIVSMSATSDGGGYWLLGADGGVFAFGDAHYSGGLGGTTAVGFVGITHT